MHKAKVKGFHFLIIQGGDGLKKKYRQSIEKTYKDFRNAILFKMKFLKKALNTIFACFFVFFIFETNLQFTKMKSTRLLTTL